MNQAQFLRALRAKVKKTKAIFVQRKNGYIRLKGKHICPIHFLARHAPNYWEAARELKIPYNPRMDIIQAADERPSELRPDQQKLRLAIKKAVGLA